MTQCPCGNAVEYSSCCEPYISGDRFAPSAEALMRSRYTAYVNGATAYLRSTLAPSSRGDYDENSVREWSKNSEWLGLQILSAGHDKVEFVAKYKTDGKVLEHHEVARFKKLQDRWYFIDQIPCARRGAGHEPPRRRAGVVSPRWGETIRAPAAAEKIQKVLRWMISFFSP